MWSNPKKSPKTYIKIIFTNSSITYFKITIYWQFYIICICIIMQIPACAPQFAICAIDEMYKTIQIWFVVLSQTETLENKYSMIKIRKGYIFPSEKTRGASSPFLPKPPTLRAWEQVVTMETIVLKVKLMYLINPLIYDSTFKALWPSFNEI